MSERDDDEVSAAPAADDDNADDAATRLGDGTATAFEAGNPSAIRGIANAITALNGSASIGTPNWHQLMPKFDMPAPDFPMPKFDVPAIDFPKFHMPVIDFPIPKFDVGQHFDVGRFTGDAIGIDSVIGSRHVADAYLRGIGGAAEAFTRATHALEGIAAHTELNRTGAITRAIDALGGQWAATAAARDLLGGHVGFSARDLLGGSICPDYGQQFRDIVSGPASFTGWLDSAVPRIDMAPGPT